MINALTIQDISCFGQCSITVALPVLSAFGIETAILPSSVMSTHTGGFSGYTIHDLTDEMPKIAEHWKKEKIGFDAIYTGYIGDERQFDIIADISDELMKEGGKLIVDPAMADDGVLYKALGDNIVTGMKKLVSKADIIIPNITEAALLTGMDYIHECDEEHAKEYLKELAKLGPEICVLTGVYSGKDRMGASAYIKKEDKYVSYFAERMENRYHGTGDVFASVFTANILRGRTLDESIKGACEFVVDCIRYTDKYPQHKYGICFESVLAKGRYL